jgi:spore germination protein GerM
MTLGREEACLRSIALSLTELQSIDKVKIMVENKNIESLGGNFNISKPFNNDDINLIKIKKK